MTGLTPDTPLGAVRGIGPRRAEALAEAGARTVEDLLFVLPFRYEDRRAFGRITDLEPGGPEATLAVEVASSRLIRTRRRGFTIFEADLRDRSGTIRAVWYNQPYLARVVVPGRRLVVFARPTSDRRGGGPVLENPEHERLDAEDAEGIHTGRIVPVYRRIGPLGPRMLRGLIHRVLAELDAESVPAVLPEAVRRRHDLLRRLEAIRGVHFPPADASLAELAAGATPGHRRLAFEEMFVVQVALARQRRLRQAGGGSGLRFRTERLERLVRRLPFELTTEQRRVLGEVVRDLRARRPMSRLLQGDVGSGKTVVALLAMRVMAESGRQAVLMAPTEILVEQHLRTARAVLGEVHDRYGLTVLTGSMSTQDRRRRLSDVAAGRARLVIGTHVLFERAVRFSDLGLVVVDEQHRFGVAQRAALLAKGDAPDLLVMTATPIPRSLAMTVYGDLELSAIRGFPPGRTGVTTVVRAEADRSRVNAGVRREIARGGQAFVVVPRVEGGDGKLELKAAVEHAERLRRDVFPDLRVGLLHGRMRGEDKDAAMRAFAAGEFDVLVATTVVEVGIDVPNASVMVVEHAERFGLSQLHQLRGRVGRGSRRSYCVLMVGDDRTGREGRERLEILESTSDGFEVAERDLALRGPGAVFSTEQHGLGDLRFLAQVLREPGLLFAARDAARALVRRSTDRDLDRFATALRPAWRCRLALGRVG